MKGAEFNSDARDPPPRCHPNTRVSIIQRAKHWIRNPGREKKLLWVRGPAGVGKSAIIQTLAEALAKEGCLGASVFFSRPNGRNNPNQVFPSIAYQLAVQDASYKAYITDLMLKDPRSLEKSMKEQFRLLFVKPFIGKQLRNGSDVLVVTLDGLDECGGDPAERASDRARSRKRSSDYVQREIVELISSFVLEYPSVPLIWIIASRPEKYLQAVFYDEDVQLSFWEENIPVDSVEACLDVERFLHKEFMRIQRKYADHIAADTTTWPSNEQFLLIARAASGLFIFAEVVIRFIDDPMVNNPVAQLSYVLHTISTISPSQNGRNPLAVLDVIYTEIISQIPPDMLEAAKKLIACIVHYDRRLIGLPTHLCLICNCLGIRRDVAITILFHLHSVIYIPGVEDIGMARPRLYHASFRDFLEDASRSHEFSIAKSWDEGNLLQGLFKLLQTGYLCGKWADFLVPQSNLRNLRLTENLLPWPGEESLKYLRDHLAKMIHSIGLSSSEPVTVDSFGNSFRVMDVQFPIFFVNLNFAEFIGRWPLTVDQLDKISVRSRSRHHNIPAFSSGG